MTINTVVLTVAYFAMAFQIRVAKEDVNAIQRMLKEIRIIMACAWPTTHFREHTHVYLSSSVAVPLLGHV